MSISDTLGDTVQWFDALGKCRCGCGKPATGILRGFYGNESYGAYTEACSRKRIKACHKKGKFAPDCVVGDVP